MVIRKGRIKDFIGSWSSGLGFLVIEDSETGEIEQLPCDNGPTVRALENCFGDVITPNHTAKGNGYRNQEIFWSMDELGLVLGGFTPVEDAPFELVETYENQKQSVKRGG
ncbi:hypothetical protein ES703_42402 [subsurface metagenome]